MNKIMFSYRGRDSQGAPASGTVEAADKEDALRKLRSLEAEGLCDLSIEGVQQLNGSPSTATSPATNKRFCGSCGAANPTDHKFCVGCGKSLGEAIQDRAAGQPVAAVKQGHGKLTMRRVIFLVCLSGFLFGGVVVGALIWASLTPPLSSNSAPRPSPPAAKAGRYEIATTKDVSMKAVASLFSVSASELRHTPTNVRKVVRIVVDPGLSQAQYAATIEQAIRDLTEKDRDIDEIMLFVYDDASDVDGGYTVARAEWAPNGKWGRGAVTSAIASSNNRRSYRTTIEWAARHRGQ